MNVERFENLGIKSFPQYECTIILYVSNIVFLNISILLATSSSTESSINIVEALSSDEITAGPYLSKFFPIEREIYPKHEKISGFISNGASGFYFIINDYI